MSLPIFLRKKEKRETRQRYLSFGRATIVFYYKKDNINYKDVELLMDQYKVPKFENRESYSEHFHKLGPKNTNLSLIERADRLITTLKTRSPYRNHTKEEFIISKPSPKQNSTLNLSPVVQHNFLQETPAILEPENRKIGIIKTVHLPSNKSSAIESQQFEQMLPKFDSPNFKEYHFDAYLNSPPNYIKDLRNSSHSPRKVMNSGEYTTFAEKEGSKKFESGIFLGDRSKIIEQYVPHHERMEYKRLVNETYSNGTRYEGEKVGDFRHGKGKYIYNDGGYYEGEWRENKMNGIGNLYYPSHKLAYKGEWIENKFNGKGVLFNEHPTFCDFPLDYYDLENLGLYWEYYEGDFLDDCKNGFGKIKMSNGEFFEGYFEKDFANGKGVYLTLDGKKLNGEWKENRLLNFL